MNGSVESDMKIFFALMTIIEHALVLVVQVALTLHGFTLHDSHFTIINLFIIKVNTIH